MAAIRSNAPPDLVLSVCHGDLVNVSHVRRIQLSEGRKQPGHKRKDRHYGGKGTQERQGVIDKMVKDGENESGPE